MKLQFKHRIFCSSKQINGIKLMQVVSEVTEYFSFRELTHTLEEKERLFYASYLFFSF